MCDYINKIPDNFPDYTKYMRVNNLCNTLSGKATPIFTITEDIEDILNPEQEAIAMKNTAKFYRHWKRQVEELDKIANQGPS